MKQPANLAIQAYLAIVQYAIQIILFQADIALDVIQIAKSYLINYFI